MSNILTEGFSTIVTFSLNGSPGFAEKTVQPPGLDSGGPNDTTTMRNTRWRTMQPKKLVTATPIKGKAAYATSVYTALISMLGQNQQITVTFSDLTKVTIWGYLDKFEPQEVKEGSQPEADFTVQPTNQDNSGNEQAPVWSLT